MKIKKIFSKRKMAIGLLAGLCIFIWVRNILADDDDGQIDLRKNIIAIHDSNSEKYNKNCKECHADIRNAQSLDPSIPSVHVAMFPATPGKPGDNKQCIWCHRTVDLVLGTQTVEKSQGNLRKQVDATLCALCHGDGDFDRTGPSGRPVKQFYRAGPSPDDGALLYDLACAACHKDLASSKVKGESAQEIWKKINENEAGMGPLKILSETEINAIAAALAESGGDDGDDD
jgi:cytochrome c553